jgi:probable HAF family extracellular repeat protein
MLRLNVFRAVLRERGFWFVTIALVGSACTGTPPGVAVPSGIAVPPFTQSSVEWSQYHVVDLGTLGGSFSEASGISDSGVVSGFSATKNDAQFQVFAWREGKMRAMPGFGGPISYSWTINDRNEISGFSETATPDPNGEDVNGLGTYLISLPAFWRGAHLSTLPLVGGNNGNALGLNNVGQVGGWSEINKHDPTCVKPQVLGLKPVIWKEGKIDKVLPTWRGDSIGAVIDINDRGDAIGASGRCDQAAASVPLNIRHGLLWRDGKMIDLGNLGGRIATEPIAINKDDQIVGQSDLPGDKKYHAFLWDGTMKDLGALPGDCCSVANWVADDGTVAGYSCLHPGQRAMPRGKRFKNCRGFLWKNGTMVDVNTLIPTDSAWYITGIDALNRNGQLVGVAYGKKSNAERGFLATPTGSR